MDQPPSILSISPYAPLRHTREWILKRAGFNVTSAADFSEAVRQCRARAFDVVVIGHAIPLGDYAKLISKLKRDNHTRVLSLCRRGDPLLAGADAWLDAMEGPEKLIETIRAVMKKSH